MKKTKIICTIGPACNSIETLKALVKNGMNVARINMSHGDFSSHQQSIDLIKLVRKELNIPIAIMLDTKGPEIRFGEFPKKGVQLEEGSIFTICKKQIMGSNKIASISYQNLISDVKIGDKIYANNGMLVLKVISQSDDAIATKVLFGGKLTTHKGINVPGIKIRENYLSDVDKKDLLFAISNDVEYIAASFVSNVENILEMKSFIAENGGKAIRIISKIENAEGVRNIESIAQESDGIMIARGDLGVEIPLEKIPHIQKKIIKTCNCLGKISIVATEMLESMTFSVRPTRAEVSDVAGAIYEGASATMLSGETAVGAHPAKVVSTMSKVIVETEKNINYNQNFEHSLTKSLSITDSLAQSTCKNAISLDAKACCIYTETGISAQLISRYRTKNRIIALTANPKTYHALSLCWNTTPIFTKNLINEYEMIENAKTTCKDLHFACSGDIIVVTIGTPQQTGKTNTIKIVSI